MQTKFFQIKNLPPLPELYVKEGLDNGFEFSASPYILAKPATLFNSTNFRKILDNRFGEVVCRYLKNPPNSLYDWHIDKVRRCSLNWIIKTNPGAKTFYRSQLRHRLFWDIEEVKYDIECPTLLDTKQEHCVFNNWPEDRIILSISILNDHSYEETLEFLTSLNIDQY